MSEIRLASRSRCTMSLLFALGLFGCGAARPPLPTASTDPIERLRAESCAHLGDGGDSWSGARVKAALSCVLAGSPDAQAQRQFLLELHALPPEAFAESAKWLERNLAPAMRGTFLTALEELNPALGSVLEESANQSFWKIEKLGELLPLIEAALPSFVENDSALEHLERLGQALQPSYRDTRHLLAQLGPRPFALQAHSLANMPAADLLQYGDLVQSFLEDVGPDRDVQRQISIYTHDIPCARDPRYVTRAPFRSCLAFISEGGQSPERLFASIAQAYLYWESSCHLPAEIGPGSRLGFWEFLLEPTRYARLNHLAKLGFGQSLHEQHLVGRILEQSSREVSARNLVARLADTQGIPFFTQLLAGNPLLRQRIGQSPVELLEQILREFPRLHSLESLSIAERRGALRGLRALLHWSRPSPALIAEWQQLALRPVPLLGAWLRQGRIRDLARLLRSLSGQAPTPLPPIPPQTLQDPARFTLLARNAWTPQLAELGAAGAISACLRLYESGNRAPTLMESLRCLEDRAIPVGVPSAFLARPEASSFFANLAPSTPLFPLLQELSHSDPLNTLHTRTLWLPLLARLAPLEWNPRGALQWLAAAPKVLFETEAAPLLRMSWATPPLPTTSSVRQKLAIPSRLQLADFATHEVLWKTWLQHHAPTAAADLLTAPSMRQAWDSLLRVSQMKLPVTLAQGSFVLNGTELFDLLLWEAQIPELGDLHRELIRAIVEIRRPEHVSRVLDLIARLGPIGKVLLVNNPRALRQLDNTLALLDVIRNNISANDLFALTQVLNNMAPGQWNDDDRTALWLGLHRVGLFPALGRAIATHPAFVQWLQSNNLSPQLRPALLRLLAPPLAQLGQDIRASDVYFAALNNQQLDHYPAEVAFGWALQALGQLRELPADSVVVAPLLGWLTHGSSVALPLLRAFRELDRPLTIDDLRLGAQAVALVLGSAPLDRRTHVLSAARDSAVWFLQSPGADKLLEELGHPRGRTGLPAWLGEGHAHKLFQWAQLLQRAP